MHTNPSPTYVNALATPDEGQWPIGHGQPVQLHTSARRSRSGLGRITAGRLVVGAGLDETFLELGVMPAGDASARLLTDVPQLAGGIELGAGLLSTSPSGHWHLTGLAVIAGEPFPASIEAWYQGVYRRAGVSAVWLSLRAHLDLTVGRHRRRLLLSTELTAGPHLADRRAVPPSAFAVAA
jgi:hypothetical protein